MERFNEAQKAGEELEKRLLKDAGFHLRWTEACENILRSEDENSWKSLANELQKMCRVEEMDIYHNQSTHDYQLVYQSSQEESQFMSSPVALLGDQSCITVRESQDLASYSCIALVSYKASDSPVTPIVVALKKLHFLDLNRSNLILMRELIKVMTLRFVSQDRDN